MSFGTVVSAGWVWRIEWVNIFGSYGGKTLDADLIRPSTTRPVWPGWTS